MLKLARCSLIAACAALFAPAPAVPVVQEAVPKAADDVVLEFDADGEPFAEFLTLFQKLLQVPVDALPEEVQSVRVRAEGPQRVERERLRDYFDSVLQRYGFWSWDDVAGGSSQIVVRKMIQGGNRGAVVPAFTPRFVGLEELQAGPQPRLPLYSMSFQLEHLEPRDTLVLLSMSLNNAVESVRAVEGNRVLLVTASRDHLLYVRDLLAKADVPPAEGFLPGDRLAALEKRLTAIEARLAALEAPPAR